MPAQQPHHAAPPHPQQAARLAALRRYGILDTPAEEVFDDITKLAAAICHTPIAVINFVDEARQWFKSEIGLGVRETPLDVSICAHAILRPGLFVVPDTLKDERFATNPLVAGDPRLRFYAGALLESQDGQPIGTLCVLDYEPRTLTQEQRDTLKILARTVMAHLDLRLSLAAQNALLAEKEILLQEINHRVKNSLQMTSSMLHLQSRRTKDAAASEDFRAASSRIQAIAQVHEQLYRSDVTGQLALGRYLQDLCTDLQRTVAIPGQRLSIMVEGDDPQVPLDKVTTLGLIVSELVTNAVKYAYLPSHPNAIITVSLQATQDGLVLRVSDEGAGLPSGFDPTQGKGLGMRLVAALAEQLQGSLTVEPRRQGSCFAVSCPIS